ncbi:LysM peptidoglycan-binding domain-containing protein [Neobacillus sp. PS3-34]|uniref:LysM peptidoglycan-binding domain-containing protein n=1 Tax=Neobacillus sp. PS3-34 TaxID=3070678 RepID=UPI0027DF5B29|nr:LysM peptidoglycan-binding domain-containing protein [Neobacillus sp. PS3-34]WML48332.1 LysM peptidoglycan-binding domain-containing protein [Neobacillus sp. PS3-34]
MLKKLFAMTSFLLFSILMVSNASASTEVNIPLNVDLKQKITTDIAQFHEFNHAVVQNQTIYVPERQGNKITAINALDHSIKWEYATNANTAYYQFSGINDILFFQANGTLTALKDNGTGATVLWTKPFTLSNIAIDGSTLYGFTGGKVVALDAANGEQKWEYTLPTREKPNSNIAVGNGNIYFVTDNQIDMVRKMYAINASTAQALWTTTNVDYYSQKLFFTDGKIYVNSYDKMKAFDATNGADLWNFTVQSNFDFEMNAATIFTKTSDGYVTAYDRITKAQLWKTKTGSNTRGPIILTPSYIIVNGDSVIKWLDIYNGQLARTMTEPGVNYQPYTAVDGALVAMDSSYNLYYYAAANDTVKPVLTLDSVPNRFSPYESNPAQLNFYLSEDAYVKMTVKNSQGQAVRTSDFGLLNSGWNYKTWDGKDDSGQVVPYGAYTLSFEVKDLSGNTTISENTAKKMNVADIKGTTVTETISRKGAGTTYDVLATIPSGTQVTILDETTDWFKVNFTINSTIYEGYVQKSVVATRSNPNPQPTTPAGTNSVIYTVQSGDTLWKVAQKFNVTTQAIVDANNLDPAKYLSVGQKLTIPGQAAQPEQPVTGTTYTVQSGDTLWKVAQKFNVTTQAIVDANKLDPTKYLYVGQKLTIPTVAQPAQTTYVVQSGDTLWKVAQKFGVTTQAIIDANKLDPTQYLYVGQKLIIPVAPPATTTYSVQSGDTLWKVAQKFGVTTQAIVDANKLDPTKYLYIGQKLIIPAK